VSGDISLADYEAAARVYCYGHSPEMLNTIDELTCELEKIPSRFAKDAVFILADAKNRKITDTERHYIAMLSELFARTRKTERGKRENLAAWGLGGLALFAAIRATLGLTGWISDLMWAILGLVALLAAPVFILDPISVLASEMREERRLRELEENDPFNQNPFRRIRNTPEEYGWEPNGGLSVMAHFLGLFLVLYMVALERYVPLVVRTLSLAFPIIGAFLGAGISYALYNYKMRRLRKEIDSACDLLGRTTDARESLIQCLATGGDRCERMRGSGHIDGKLD
jgi:uncharacterized membrane protein